MSLVEQLTQAFHGNGWTDVVVQPHGENIWSARPGDDDPKKFFYLEWSLDLKHQIAVVRNFKVDPDLRHISGVGKTALHELARHVLSCDVSLIKLNNLMNDGFVFWPRHGAVPAANLKCVSNAIGNVLRDKNLGEDDREKLQRAFLISQENPRQALADISDKTGELGLPIPTLRKVTQSNRRFRTLLMDLNSPIVRKRLSL